MVAGLLGAPSPGRPFAYDPRGTMEALRFKTTPKFSAVATAVGPLCVKLRQVWIERTLPRTEDIAMSTPEHMSDELPANDRSCEQSA